jgi:hypothetical protein
MHLAHDVQVRVSASLLPYKVTEKVTMTLAVSDRQL